MEQFILKKMNQWKVLLRKLVSRLGKIGLKEDLYASVMIAQAILESASGQSELAQAPNYNLLSGIKEVTKEKCDI